ncbi:MAG: class I SAM-dependent methyltransferase [Chloroflexota bacterium]|nr:class I SAM-dependent methyltransferase [Chloroflexota bacterium]
MKLTRLEKMFVNRRKEAERNIDRIRRDLEQLDVDAIHDVLEIGCGVGAISAFLADSYGMNVQGTDFDPGQVELARTRQPTSDRLRFTVEDAARLTFENASFDLVLSQDIFHHIPDWEQVVKEVVRVLRPEGYFIWLDVVSPRSIARLFQPLVKNYLSLFTLEQAQSTFAQGGLEQRFYERVDLVHHHIILQKG